MACRDLPQVARAYQRAADELLEQALSKYEPHELDYPVLFLYRHTVEVYLKAALDKPPGHHDLSMLIPSLEAESGKKLAPWAGTGCGISTGSTRWRRCFGTPTRLRTANCGSTSINFGP